VIHRLAVHTALTIGIVGFFLLTNGSFTWASEPENWVHWRGPTLDGVAGIAAKPPVEWNAKKNIAWVVDLPGEGSATPIVLGDQIFVLSAEKTDRKSPSPIAVDQRARTVPDEHFYRFVVTSLDRYSGKLRWQRTAIEQVPHEGRHNTHTYAAGSPTTDGRNLFVSFGSRGLFCYSLEGELKWQVDLGDMRTRLGWGEAITPVLAGDLLIVNWDQEDESFLVALNKLTGDTVWKASRTGEVTSWNTPLVTTFNEKRIIVVNGTGKVKAYAAESGEELWSCAGQTTNPIPTPVRFQDTVICMSGYRGAYACSIPLNSRGDVTGSSTLRWEAKQGTPYVPSPVVSGKRLFFTGGNTDVLTCLDVITGKPLIDRRRLSGITTMYASPISANGHVYFVGREGTAVILKDNENLDVAAINTLEGTFDASPVSVNDQLFLRSWSKLYCIKAASPR
jgi:outer membrane protein assembly factor BamB